MGAIRCDSRHVYSWLILCTLGGMYNKIHTRHTCCSMWLLVEGCSFTRCVDASTFVHSLTAALTHTSIRSITNMLIGHVIKDVVTPYTHISEASRYILYTVIYQSVFPTPTIYFERRYFFAFWPPCCIRFQLVWPYLTEKCAALDITIARFHCIQRYRINCLPDSTS